MQRFSALSLLRHALGGHTGWQPQWRAPDAETGVRRADRRRRRARPGHRLLPGQGTRPAQHRRAGARLDRRRQHRPQHDDDPLQLPVRRKRRAVRPRGAAVGDAVAGAELQRDVQPARRDDAGAQPARRAGVQAARARQPRCRGGQRMADAAAGKGVLPAAERSGPSCATRCSVRHCNAAAAWRGTTRWRGDMRAPPTRSASTSCRTARSPASIAMPPARSAACRPRAARSARQKSAWSRPATPAW